MPEAYTPIHYDHLYGGGSLNDTCIYIGEVTAVNENSNTLDVLFPDPVGQKDLVPIHYHCEGESSTIIHGWEAFAVGDEVLVLNSDRTDNSVSNLRVIGFADGWPRTCWKKHCIYITVGAKAADDKYWRWLWDLEADEAVVMRDPDGNQIDNPNGKTTTANNSFDTWISTKFVSESLSTLWTRTGISTTCNPTSQGLNGFNFAIGQSDENCMRPNFEIGLDDGNYDCSDSETSGIYKNDGTAGEDSTYVTAVDVISGDITFSYELHHANTTHYNEATSSALCCANYTSQNGSSINTSQRKIIDLTATGTVTFVAGTITSTASYTWEHTVEDPFQNKTHSGTLTDGTVVLAPSSNPIATYTITAVPDDEFYLALHGKYSASFVASISVFQYTDWTASYNETSVPNLIYALWPRAVQGVSTSSDTDICQIVVKAEYLPSGTTSVNPTTVAAQTELAASLTTKLTGSTTAVAIYNLAISGLGTAMVKAEDF